MLTAEVPATQFLECLHINCIDSLHISSKTNYNTFECLALLVAGQMQVFCNHDGLKTLLLAAGGLVDRSEGCFKSKCC